MDQFQLLDKGKEELKSAIIMSMELCVMISGTDLMVMLSADSSTSLLVCSVIKFKEPVSSISVPIPIPSFSMLHTEVWEGLWKYGN